MSLDVYLSVAGVKRPKKAGRIFIRWNGQTREISRATWDELNPGVEPVTVNDAEESDRVYHANITHNLIDMAEAADLYKPLWRPDEIGLAKAHQLVEPLTQGLAKLRAEPDTFRVFNPANGWGNCEIFVSFVERYLEACRAYPDADVSVWR